MESFATLTEFAVAIAGFSGIAIAIGARNGVVSSLTQFRNRNLLNFSIGAAFGSVLPPLVSHLGASGVSIWTYSSGLFFAISVVPFRACRQGAPAGAPQSSHSRAFSERE